MRIVTFIQTSNIQRKFGSLLEILMAIEALEREHNLSAGV